MRRREVRGRESAGERGAVTAELAMGLPVLLAVTAVMVWLLSLGVSQARVVDASREAARILARGDDGAIAVAAARRIAPDGAVVRVHRSGGEVRVVTSVRMRGPGGLPPWPRVRLTSEAVALDEQTEGVP